MRCFRRYAAALIFGLAACALLGRSVPRASAQEVNRVYVTQLALRSGALIDERGVVHHYVVDEYTRINFDDLVGFAEGARFVVVSEEDDGSGDVPAYALAVYLIGRQLLPAIPVPE